MGNHCGLSKKLDLKVDKDFHHINGGVVEQPPLRFAEKHFLELQFYLKSCVKYCGCKNSWSGEAQSSSGTNVNKELSL